MISFLLLTIENESDREFMADIFERYSHLMYYKIRNVVHDPWAVDDILQTTVEKLIDKVQTLRKLREDQLASYVATAARNNAYTYLRNKKEFLCFDATEVVDTYDIESAVLRKEDINRLAELWNALNERDQYFLSSRYILGMSTKEIAAELGIKPESVRMALTRARREAYRLLEDTD